MTIPDYRTWTRANYTLTTDPSLIPLASLNAVFDTSEFSWAIPLPESALSTMLAHSLSFAIYKDLPVLGSIDASGPGTNFIGYARAVTDHTTLFYLTDVWIAPAERGHGLSSWLIACVREVVESMPYLRRSMLTIGDWERMMPFYERALGMKVAEGKRGGMAFMTKLGPGFPKGEH